MQKAVTWHQCCSKIPTPKFKIISRHHFVHPHHSVSLTGTQKYVACLNVSWTAISLYQFSLPYGVTSRTRHRRPSLGRSDSSVACCSLAPPDGQERKHVFRSANVATRYSVIAYHNFQFALFFKNSVPFYSSILPSSIFGGLCGYSIFVMTQTLQWKFLRYSNVSLRVDEIISDIPDEKGTTWSLLQRLPINFHARKRNLDHRKSNFLEK